MCIKLIVGIKPIYEKAAALVPFNTAVSLCLSIDLLISVLGAFQKYPVLSSEYVHIYVGLRLALIITADTKAFYYLNSRD